MSGWTTVKRAAHAKVNLALAVGAPREDGLHPIASWFTGIDLCDEVTVARLPESRASRYAIVWAQDAPRPSNVDWPITKDLAVRAHRLLEEEAARPLPVQMKVEKRIPVGAGLGGGSSDAAAALIAVREAFELDVTDERLGELALSLGADVPFFLAPEAPGAALVRGVGERIERTGRVGGVELVVLVPDFGCATGAVYGAFDELRARGAMREERVAEMARGGVARTGELFNDLAQAAERAEPRLAGVRSTAREACETEVHVTGSGSAMFVVCEAGTMEAARAERAILRGVEGLAVFGAALA